MISSLNFSGIESRRLLINTFAGKKAQGIIQRRNENQLNQNTVFGFEGHVEQTLEMIKEEKASGKFFSLTISALDESLPSYIANYITYAIFSITYDP